MTGDLFRALDEPLPMPNARHGFLVTGPNSSGKTTAVRAALEPWRHDRRVVAFHPDSERAADKIDAIADEVWQRWETAATVVVVEGTNRGAHAVIRVLQRDPGMRRFEALVTEMTSGAMRASLQRRCAKTGKQFRDDYWTERVLDYEARRRYRRLAELYLGPRVTFWPVDVDYAGAARLTTYLRERVAACLAS